MRSKEDIQKLMAVIALTGMATQMGVTGSDDSGLTEKQQSRVAYKIFEALEWASGVDNNLNEAFAICENATGKMKDLIDKILEKVQKGEPLTGKTPEPSNRFTPEIKLNIPFFNKSA